MTDTPIGIFDSGVGGLTVARAILDQLPHEQLCYLGDTAHVPYGPKPIAEVRWHALAGLDQLATQGVKMLVIACNAATAACLPDARERFPVPVLEVIRPAVRRAVAATRNGRIGVIGTSATIGSGAYQDAFAAAPQVQVTSVACPQFVDYVERGVTTGAALRGLAQANLEPLQRAGVDTVVLGCTHYPLLAGLIGMVMGDEVTLVSSADETARDVYRALTEAGLARPDTAPAPQHRFLATGDAEAFARLAHRFLGAELFTVTGDPAGTVAAAASNASGSRHLTASPVPAGTVATATASGSGHIAVSAAPTETVATATAGGSGHIAVSAASVGAPP